MILTRLPRFHRALWALVVLAWFGGCEQRAPEPRARGTQPAGKPVGARRIPADVELDQLPGKTVLLVTHPSRRILESVRLLVQQKLLRVPNLFVVGLYHADEQESYEPSYRLLKQESLPWLGLKRLSCPLAAEDVYKENRCTAVFRELLDRSAGMLFTGGPDIPPALYGEKTLLTTVIRAPRRHYWEISLLFHLLGGSRNPGFKALLHHRPDYPLLAICLGLQSMNVAAGGTLYQDIFSEIYGAETFEEILRMDPELIHRNPHFYLAPAAGIWPGVFHPIRFSGDVALGRTLIPDGEPVQVMSVHHQAIERLGKDLVVIATSKDEKVVEAIGHTRFPNVLGIQFHPEYNVIWDASLTATERAGDARGNAFFGRLQGDARSLKFHRSLWQLISARYSAKAAP